MTYKRVGRPRPSLTKTRFAREAVGEPVGTSNTKMFQSSVSGLIGTRVLNNMTLTACSQGTAINQRLRDVINCRGFSVKGLLRSTTTSPEILTCNIAVVCQKDPSVTGLATVDEFFRNCGDPTDLTRGLDFSDSRSSIEFSSFPLNTDKFTVMKHERFCLGPPAAGMDIYFKNIDWWIPLNRQITYKGGAVGDTNDQLLVLFWFDILGALSTSTTLANKCFVQMTAITHFREAPL